jgi:hypothetical protein
VLYGLDGSARDMARWKVLVNTVMKLGLHEMLRSC